MPRTPSSLRPFLAALLIALGSCGSSEEGPVYKHVLLISLDTTRADQLGCYGGRSAQTPRIDEVARGGIVFEQTMAAAPSTLASHTSIMTGLYPRRHGVARNGFTVNPENVMLAEVLRDNDFHTAGFIASFALDEVFGFDQGFNWWDQDFGTEVGAARTELNQRRGEAVTDAVLDHLDQYDGGDRLFLFAHYFDSHSPYDPPEPYSSEYAIPGGLQTSDFGTLGRQITMHQELVNGKKRAVYDLGLSQDLARYSLAEKLPGDEDLKALYSGELAYLDAQVGRLLDGLASRGILEDTVIIITGDHGETFWEHGDFWHHGAWVYQTNVHVPFIVSLPDGRGKGERVSTPVSGVDVFPMLLELLEIPLPEEVAGVSLAAAFDSKPVPTRRALFSEATQPSKRLPGGFIWENQLKAKCIRQGRWKLIEAPYLQYRELYDLKADPGEHNNLLLDMSPETRRVAERLLKSLDEWRRVQDPRPSSFKSTQMQNIQKRLQGLGYVGDLSEIDDSAD